jgi:hypothetical protein
LLLICVFRKGTLVMGLLLAVVSVSRFGVFGGQISGKMINVMITANSFCHVCRFLLVGRREFYWAQVI